MTTATVYPISRGTDLGQQNPDCTASRHGTYSAYAGGCRCPHAREAHRLYHKRHREGRLNVRLLDATGTRRSIQALWAIGHPSARIAAEAGPTYTAANIYQISKRSIVTIATRDAIRRAYRALADVQGTSVRTRRRAEKAGHLGPLAWDDDTIDNPDAQPWDGQPDISGPVVDEVAIRRALNGERIKLTRLEKHHAIHRRGRMSLQQAAAGLHLSYSRAKELAALPLPTAEECAA